MELLHVCKQLVTRWWSTWGGALTDDDDSDDDGGGQNPDMRVSGVSLRNGKIKNSGKIIVKQNFNQEVVKRAVQVVVSKWIYGLRQMPHFIGRKNILQEIHQLFLRLPNDGASITCQSKMVVLHGLGGIGKSCLAMTYANEHYQINSVKKSIVAWFRANCLESLVQDFQNLAKQLGIMIPSSDIDDTVCKLNGHQHSNKMVYLKDKLNNDLFLQVYNYLDVHKIPSLLVFDDADPTLLKYDLFNILPTHVSVNGTIPALLITSRNSQWKLPPYQLNTDQLIHILPLDDTESLTLVKTNLELTQSNSGQIDSETLTKFSRLFHGLPLAITLATSYLLCNSVPRVRTQNLVSFIEKFKKPGSDSIITPLQSAKSSNYAYVLTNVWDTSINAISKESMGHMALDFLNIMGYLPVHQTSVDTVYKIYRDRVPPQYYHDGGGGPENSVEISTEDRDSIFAILDRYSMVSMAMAKDRGTSPGSPESPVWVHQLVRKYARERLEFRPQNLNKIYHHLSSSMDPETQVNFFKECEVHLDLICLLYLFKWVSTWDGTKASLLSLLTCLTGCDHCRVDGQTFSEALTLWLQDISNPGAAASFSALIQTTSRVKKLKWISKWYTKKLTGKTLAATGLGGCPMAIPLVDDSGNFDLQQVVNIITQTMMDCDHGNGIVHWTGWKLLNSFIHERPAFLIPDTLEPARRDIWTFALNSLFTLQNVGDQVRAGNIVSSLVAGTAFNRISAHLQKKFYPVLRPIQGPNASCTLGFFNMTAMES